MTTPAVPGEFEHPDADGHPCPECGLPFGERPDELSPPCPYCLAADGRPSPPVDDEYALPLCVLCEQRIHPDDMALRCTRAMGQRCTHEVLNAPKWRPGDPVRPGHSIHVKGCERAMDPSVYADPPCTCHCPSVPGDAPTPAALAILGFARSDHRWSTEAVAKSPKEAAVSGSSGPVEP